MTKQTSGAVNGIARLSTTVAVLLALSGCGGGGGGGLVSPSSQISSLTISTSGYTGSLDSARVALFQASQEYKNVSQYSSSGTGSAVASDLHPFTLTNVDKAYGYGLSGNGVTIGLIDSGFASEADYAQGNAFLEMQTKKNKVTFTSSITNPCSGSSCNTHGTNVASVAAANFDDQGDQYFLSNTGLTYNAYSGDSFPLLNHGMMGVAYRSSLRIGDFNTFNGSLSGIAQLTTGMAGAKVLNNSWGLEINLPTNIPADIATYTPSQASEWLRGATGGIYASSDLANLYSAYKNFQNSGVVVFALQNTTSDATPSLMAALPEIFPDLENAWIAVGNIDTRGVSRDSIQVSRRSARCGATAPYCLVTDGTELTGAGLYARDGYSRGITGTSFSAPQVSGMIALLAEAFPSLNSSQLAARLLATAYNKFTGFTAAGSKSFGNGIVHQYSTEFGHGIPDMQAALNPIISNSIPVGFVLNSSPTSSERFSLEKTQIRDNPIYGDALGKAFQGRIAYAYDALGGGFPIRVSSLRAPAKVYPGLSAAVTAGFGPKRKTQLTNHLKKFSPRITMGINADLYSFNRLADSSLRSPLNTELFKQNNFSLTDSDRGVTSKTLDFIVGFNLDKNIQVSSFASTDRTPNSSSHEEKNQTDLIGLTVGHQLSLTNDLSVRLMTGYMQELNKTKGLQGAGAFNAGNQSSSLFLSPSVSFNAPKFAVKVEMAIEYAQGKLSSSMLSLNRPIVTSSFLAQANWLDSWRKNDLAYLKLWQPERVEQGSATLRLPTLVSPLSTVENSVEEISLKPSKRTLNIAIGYEYPLSQSQRVVSEFLYSKHPGHSGENQDVGVGKIVWIKNF